MAFNTPNLFLKTIPITISGADVTAGYKTLAYTDRIEATSEDMVKVYCNGQLVPEGASADSKFYYELVTVIDGTWPGAGPGVPVTSDASTATFTLRRNAAYRGPGYASGYSDNTLSIYDTFVISYYYTVYMV